MNCSAVRELLPAYVLGALEAKERARVEAHLGRCGECASEARAGLEVTSLLATLVPSATPPVALRDRVMSAARQQRPRATSAGDARRWWNPALAGALGVLTLVLLAVAAFATIEVRALRSQDRRLVQQIREQNLQIERTAKLLREQRSVAYMLATPGVRVVLVKGTEVSPKAYGMLMLSPDGDRAILVAAGLDPPPQGAAYQVWLVRGEKPVSAGLLVPDELGWAQLQVRESGMTTKYQRLGVTVEPAGGSSGPTGPRVLAVEMGSQ